MQSARIEAVDYRRNMIASCVYIDDTSKNVEMAVQLGMRGVVFRDSAGLRTELTRTGLLVDKIQGRLL